MTQNFYPFVYKSQAKIQFRYSLPAMLKFHLKVENRRQLNSNLVEYEQIDKMMRKTPLDGLSNVYVIRSTTYEP